MLHYSCAHGHVITTRTILDLREKYLLTPWQLQGMTEDQAEDAEDALLAAKRMLALRDANGSSPLHLAVAGNHLDIVKMLLLAGADITGCDASGRTPLAVALARTRVMGLRGGGGDGKPVSPIVKRLNEMAELLQMHHTHAVNSRDTALLDMESLRIGSTVEEARQLDALASRFAFSL
ncbi:hypothetical protein HDU98_007728 [Podochytrium sp. JEL0797]|nr:hypothetical protein HDU98_007728 [Podochytrium sp. JEL0797]